MRYYLLPSKNITYKNQDNQIIIDLQFGMAKTFFSNEENILPPNYKNTHGRPEVIYEYSVTCNITGHPNKHTSLSYVLKIRKIHDEYYCCNTLSGQSNTQGEESNSSSAQWHLVNNPFNFLEGQISTLINFKSIPDQKESTIYTLWRGFKPASHGASIIPASSSHVFNPLITRIPGKVIKILVQEGDSISLGQTLVIIESMKMENEIKSNTDGVVKEILVREGEVLDQGVLLLSLRD